MTDDEEEQTLTLEMVREAVASLQSHPHFTPAPIPLHPFQIADMCIRPRGWFSRFVWRWVRWRYEAIPNFIVPTYPIEEEESNVSPQAL